VKKGFRSPVNKTTLIPDHTRRTISLAETYDSIHDTVVTQWVVFQRAKISMARHRLRSPLHTVSCQICSHVHHRHQWNYRIGYVSMSTNTYRKFKLGRVIVVVHSLFVQFSTTLKKRSHGRQLRPAERPLLTTRPADCGEAALRKFRPQFPKTRSSEMFSAARLLPLRCCWMQSPGAQMLRR